MEINHSGKADQFAQIANNGISFEGKNLVIPEPLCTEKNILPLFDFTNEESFMKKSKIHTAAELSAELKKQREQYSTFMCDLAPKIKQMRDRQYLSEFQWRIKSVCDERNFADVLNGQGEWDNVKIPHYGGPVGKATSYYFTTFNASRLTDCNEALFLCFKAVDYKARVFLNSTFLGEHEGFFAPFEFDIGNVVRNGENKLLVVVENDKKCGDDGNKIYAATGLGYDDPQVGWHHCPAGMGIYQDVYIEKRNQIHVHDVFVRTLPEKSEAEAWIEIFSCLEDKKDISLMLSVYGQNFDEVVVENYLYKPSSTLKVGMGDTFTEAKYASDGLLDSTIPLPVSNGINYYKVIIPFESFRWWSPKTPWLYQLQIKIIDDNNNVVDNATSQFGMRSFVMKSDGEREGALYLNGNRIRLRGANTMGHEQQCVYKKDWNQLIDDILLAKICNMNFWRLTQRPVQPEVYEYCDKLGLMTQTDLPLFGVLRRNQFYEAIRQAGEMEKLIRSHPCNILDTYINEPFPNASNRPHLHLNRDELLEFFKAADIAVHQQNPDRVIKPIDGDYDPPAPGLPDNHCYCAWYNGHGIELGKLNRGYWLPVKPGWYYGCGEFGSEGLDSVAIMRKYYPKNWLPDNELSESTWSPNKIIGSQTGMFHYFFYDTPDTLSEWAEASCEHQAWATRFMTEAFRRDYRMTSNAIHLFIDAFPAGWMKTIMDVERSPKPAYFAYRDALEPLMVSLRSDRYSAFSDNYIEAEAWVCNDLNSVPDDVFLCYQVLLNGKILKQGKVNADIPLCSSKRQGIIKAYIPSVDERSKVEIRAGLVSNGDVLTDNSIQIEVFPKKCINNHRDVCVVGNSDGNAACLAENLELNIVTFSDEAKTPIIVDNYYEYKKNEAKFLNAVANGASLVITELAPGKYEIANQQVAVKSCDMLPVQFVSRKTGHSLVDEFRANDFKFWFDSHVGYFTPILDATFIADSFNAILTSGNTDENGVWNKALAAAEYKLGKGRIIISQVHLANRADDNPVAYLFANRILFDNI